MMPNHRVTAIANEFIERARKNGKHLTHMQLQKLPFIAHGWSLAALNAPLISDSSQTWPYGPVYPELYQNLKRYGAGYVDELIRVNNRSPIPEDRGEVDRAALTAEEVKLLDLIWDRYGKFTAYQLSEITHLDGSPWTQTNNRDGVYASINDDMIREYYENILRRNSDPSS